MVECPVCSKKVAERHIYAHIDEGCVSYLEVDAQSSDTHDGSASLKRNGVADFFAKPVATPSTAQEEPESAEAQNARQYLASLPASTKKGNDPPKATTNGLKRSFDETFVKGDKHDTDTTAPKRVRANALEKAAPLAERMRPKTLDYVCGQEIVGRDGILRGLIESDRVPSMILW